MAWGDMGVSKKIRLSNGSTAWGGGGVPVTVPIQQVGILEYLRMLSSGASTYTAGTGSINRDKLGPWNLYTSVSLSPNSQAPILQTSGYGLYLVNLMKTLEADVIAPDVAAATETNAGNASDVYTGSQTTGSTYRYFLRVPVSQRLAGAGVIGMWPLANPAIQLLFSFTPNSATSASPYNIFSTTANAAPYLTTGNATVTLANPTVELHRELWQVPQSAQDYPGFDLVSTWIEEAPQGASVNSATSFTWQAQPLSGILARVGIFILDGSTNDGVATSLLNTSNALQLTYDADTAKFAESGYAAMARQRDTYGFDLPNGFFVYDLLGQGLSLQDTLNTNVVGNIKVKVSLSSALGSSNSSVKIIRQIISPLEVK